MEKTPFSAESTAKLNEAIRKLEDYSLQQIKSAEQSSASKTIELVRSILVSSFDTRLKKHKHQKLPPNNHEVLTAIEFINRNRLFIEKLKEGTPAEKELAEKFTETIHHFNESCDKRIQGCVTNKGRIASFFLKDKPKEQILPRIAMQKKITVQQHYPENSASKALHKLYSNPEIKVPISKQSAELFHMKAISLLEMYGIASNSEARFSVKNSPIYSTIEKNGTICTLSQILSLFPGQKIVVKGNSALDPKTQSSDPKTQSFNQLLPESFTLSLELTQTGFPHSTQRNGWTVAQQLIPDFPQRIDLLGSAIDLFQRRNETVTTLLQQGDLLKHAKTLLFLKKKAFAEHAEELIGLHETLTTAILQASSSEQEAFQTVQNFYSFIRNHPHPFDALSDASQAIRENFMAKPHQILLDAIIKGKSTNLGSEIADLRYEAAKIILDQAIDNTKKEYQFNHHAENHDKKIESDYIECMGNIFGKASKPIFLQYLSEDLVFHPPSLSSFESQVQDAAYLHLKDFIDELSIHLNDDQSKNLETVYQLLKKQLSSDIALFNGLSISPIPRELDDYFKQRYLSLSSI